MKIKSALSTVGRKFKAAGSATVAHTIVPVVVAADNYASRRAFHKATKPMEVDAGHTLRQVEKQQREAARAAKEAARLAKELQEAQAAAAKAQVSL